MRKGLGIASQRLEKLRNWGMQETHSNDKLDIATIKLFSQKVHIYGPGQPKTSRSLVNSNKYMKTAVIPVFGSSSLLSMSMLRALYLHPLKETLLCECIQVCNIHPWAQ